MALLTCDFFSESLMVGTSMTVVLPQETEEQIGLIDQPLDGPPPVLYLLHGLSDDHTSWRPLHLHRALRRRPAAWPW